MVRGGGGLSDWAPSRERRAARERVDEVYAAPSLATTAAAGRLWHLVALARAQVRITKEVLLTLFAQNIRNVTYPV